MDWLNVSANCALSAGVLACGMKALGWLTSVPWIAASWPVWGTVLLVFLIGFLEGRRRSCSQ